MVSDLLISVIVPVYRVEPYISECINSILRQKYSNLQVVVINDNTDDKSVEVYKSIVKDDKRFLFIDLDRNVGVGSARNIAMFRATGEYLYFLDSDDCLYDNAIQNLADSITDNVDIVEAGCSILKDGSLIGEWKKESPFDEINMYSCHLYRRGFLVDNGVFFPEWRVAQDQVFLLNARTCNPRLVNTDIKSFYYRRFSRRFDSRRYTTALAKEHVRAETEMVGLLLGNDNRLLNRALIESIRRMCISIEGMLDHMDLIELVELEYTVLELLKWLDRHEPIWAREMSLKNVTGLKEAIKRSKECFRG